MTHKISTLHIAAGGLVVFLLLCIPSSVFATPITSGPFIMDTPGTYTLIQDIPAYNGTWFDANGIEHFQPCFEIMANDVVFDGGNHLLTGSGWNATSDGQFAVYVHPGVQRFRIANLGITGNFNAGIFLDGDQTLFWSISSTPQPANLTIDGGMIEGCHIYNLPHGVNGSVAISMNLANDIRIRNNQIDQNTQGISGFVCNNPIIENNIVNSQSDTGIALVSSNNALIQQNSQVNNNGVGILIQGDRLANHRIINNTVSYSLHDGVIIWGSGESIMAPVPNPIINLRGNTITSSGGSGLVLNGTSNYRIEGNNTINSNTQNGIVIATFNITSAIFSSNKTQIINNDISQNGWNGIFADNRFDNTTEIRLSIIDANTINQNGIDGIVLTRRCLENRIGPLIAGIGNEFCGNVRNGILADVFSHGTHIGFNSICESQNGIRILGSHNSTILGNTIINMTTCGIDLYTYTDVNPIVTDPVVSINSTVVNNTVICNGGFQGITGIYVRGLDNIRPTSRNTIDPNIISGWQYGVRLFNAIWNEIHSNVITNSSVGGIELSDSLNNAIYNNYFNNVNNVVWGTATTTPNTWSVNRRLRTNIVNGPNIGGNYWAKPDGTGHSQVNPHDADGFITVAYPTSDTNPGNTDYLPLWNGLDANFLANPVSQVALPVNVTFTDNSTGNIISRSWTFGDGGTATDTNPWHLYTVEGVYPVTLTVTDIGGATDTYNVSITAGTPGLLASFIGSPTSGSANLSVVFSDTSTGGPTNWTWAFGDGGTSTVQSPNYTYTLAGNYPVSLTVTNGTLSNTTIRQGFITVNPFADFTWYPGSGSSPLTVQFNDASLGQPSQWFWEFGDGTGVTSDQQDPVHVFPTLGTYSVRLTATGGGQTNVTTRVLELNESGPFAEFIANPRDGTYPLTVEFTDLSTGNPNIWEWNFGGNETSSDTNPVHIFEEPGTYTVTLTVRNAGGWSSVTKSGYITVRNTPAPSADFTASPRTGYAPLDVEFIDMSTGVVEGAFYEWDFGDQSPVSYDRNPSHTYTTNGTFTVKLNVTNPGLPPVGCELEQTDFIAVANEPVPTARFSSDTSIGNFPLTVAFTDESSGEITSWLWTFGDGASSSEQNPSHTYATPGVYTAYLRVTDSHGRGTQATKTITVRPIASFYLEPLAGEVPLTVQFTDTSTGAPSEWLWTFGDGATSTGSDPTHTYETPGIYDITLIVTSNGAASTPAHDDIEVGSVSFNANIVASPLEGYVPLEVAFQGEATGSPTTWLWEFGDGTYSRNPQVNHTFATTGRKTVTLTVTNQSGEVATATETITVRPKADFIVTPVIGKSPTTFYMTDQSVGEIVSYFWDFCNGSNSTEKNPSITFSEASMHWVTLTVTTSDGLSDSLRKDYWVTPNASFEWYPSSESDPLTVQFIDRSAGGALFSFWDFGDGTNSTTYDIPYLLLGDEAYSNPVHVYRTLGSYQVVLTKFGFDGLSDNSTMTVTLSGTGPTADFTASPRSGGFPLEVSFIDQSTGAPTSWQWDFGDGSDFSLERNPEHTYLVPGNFNVTLTASNENGADTNEKTDYIAVSNVPPPEADFTASPRAGVKPLSVNFIDQTTGSPVAWEWDFGDGSDTSFDRNPTHDYPDPGNYTVSLKATNAEGQSGIEEKFQFITVTAVPKPVAKFTASPTTAVPPFDVYFTDQSAGNPTSWKWTFGDGSEYGGPSSLQSPRHRYYKPGYYTVTLEVSNAQGYDQTYEIDYIYARNYPPQAAFEVNPRRGAAPLVVQFSDRSTGEGIKSWNWTFGDGVSSNLQNPVYVYNTPGTYSVSLMVESDGGTSYKNEPDLITVEPPLQANNITLYGGTWNFVSTPRKLAAGHNTAGVVFAGVDTASHTILTFDAATQAWVQYKADTEVKPLDGIWIYSAGPNTVTLVFDDSTIPQPPSKQVYVGWNTVGFGGVNQASARDWLTVYSALGEKWTSALGYHNGALPDDPIIRGSTDPRYSDSRPMYPTRGYWLSMAEPGVLQGMA